MFGELGTTQKTRLETLKEEENTKNKYWNYNKNIDY